MSISKLFNNEHLLTLPEASKGLPGRPSVNTFHRWRLQGIRGVKLETVKLGGRRFVSVEALQRFFAASDPPSERSQPTPKQRQASVEAASQALSAAGV